MGNSADDPALHGTGERTPADPPDSLRPDEKTIVSGITVGLSPESAARLSNGRYDFLREVARGGMGVILQGRDQELRREIACKVLLPEHAGTPELAQRFVEEAQIAGQLQHPGIVPIYDLGRLPDDRPYFTMRLVKGRTLSAILRQRASPHDDLPRCLGVFEQVCQAMAYAHAREVIHRDLKPSNVMVGRFGEVQVMDWGLAKVLEEPTIDAHPPKPAPAADVSVIQTPRVRASEPGKAAGAGSGTGTGSETSAGSVLGTVSYMAPEQARGETDHLDKRTDVFGLGAVLCEILTGQPPYTDEDRKQLYHRAACGDLHDAMTRLDRCGADADLIALAKRCLAVAPGERPADAGEVAQAIRAHREGTQERLRRSQLDHAAAEARAEEAKVTAAAERRAKRLTGGLAAAVLLLGVLGVMGWRWKDQVRAAREKDLAARREQILERDRRAELILQESVTLQGEDKWSAALAAARRAADLVDDESAAELRERIRRQMSDLQLLETLERVRIDSLGVDVKESRISHEGLPEEFAAAFREAGLDLQQLTPDDAAERLNQTGIRDRLIAALWFWWITDPSQEMRDRLKAVLAAADRTSPARQAADALDASDTAALRDLVATTAYDTVPADMAWVVSTLLGRSDRLLSRDWLLHAQRVHPSDFWINFSLGHHLMQQGRTAEAIGYFRVALAAHPRHAGVMLNLGLSHLRQKALPEAELFYLEAIRAQPDYPSAHVGLGDALRFQGWHDAAADAYRRALELLGERRNSTWENAAIGLGEALIALKDPAAEELLQSVVAHDPRNVNAWLALGRFHYEAEDWAESERCCREALKIDQKHAQAQSGVAAALAGQKRYPEAEAAFRLARQRLGSERGDAWEHATRGLAHALASQGRNSEASRLLRELAAPGPAAAAQSLLDQAAEHRRRAEWPDAEKRYREALSLDGSNVQVRIDLGDVLSYQNRRAEAADEYRSALQLLGRERGPVWEQATLGLARALAVQDQHDDALQMLQALLEANPQNHAAHVLLGDVYREQQQWAEAERALRRATELNRADPGGHVFLGTVLVRLDRPAEAEAEFRLALERFGESRGYHWDRAAVGLALALAAQDKVEQAISELQQLAESAPSVFAGQYLLVRYHAARRDWPALAESEVALAEVAPNDDLSTIHTMHAAAAFVLAEDEDGYREACRLMLEKHGRTTQPAYADRTVKSCCLSRRFDGDIAAVLRLADVAVTDQEQHSWYVYFTLARGLAALRAGEWNDALRWARLTRDRAPNFDVTAAPARLVEALAQRRLDRPEESRQALAAAIEIRRQNAAAAEDPFASGWGEWMLFDALRADVEVMLREQ